MPSRPTIEGSGTSTGTIVTSSAFSSTASLFLALRTSCFTFDDKALLSPAPTTSSTDLFVPVELAEGASVAAFFLDTFRPLFLLKGDASEENSISTPGEVTVPVGDCDSTSSSVVALIGGRLSISSISNPPAISSSSSAAAAAKSDVSGIVADATGKFERACCGRLPMVLRPILSFSPEDTALSFVVPPGSRPGDVGGGKLVGA